MKNKFLYLLGSLLLCSSCSIVNFFTPKATILKEPSKFRSVVKGEKFNALAQNVREFSANFGFESEKVLDNQNQNYAVSPLSMFSALAVASACANGNTKQELLDALKTTDSLLTSEFGNLYAASNVQYSAGGEERQTYKKEAMGENIADHGGLRISYSAFQKTPQGKGNELIDGFTPAQRFYLSYANVWANNITKEEILRRTKVDPHSLGKNRVNVAIRNLEEFFRAFDVKEGDKMYRPEQDRVIIW